MNCDGSKIPTSLPANHITLKGIGLGSSIRYGLEPYYFLQSQQQEINQAINEAQRGQQNSLRMEIKVDARIGGVPVSLWVNKHNYQI